jgi:perosamine synthetase
MDNPEQYERAKALRWLGIDRSTWERTDKEKQYLWSYNIEEIGYKCHMNDITAALGLVQLAKLDEMQEKRVNLVNRYTSNLSGVVELPPSSDCSSWHLFVIKTDRRDELSEFLRKKGINTGVHYRPIHLYQCYGNVSPLPAAEKEWLKILTLPLYPALEESQVDFICDSIKEFR